MKLNRFSRAGMTVTAGALALSLAACGSDDPLAGRPGLGGGTAESNGSVSVTGNFAGAGASSIEAAMDAWRATFQNEHPGVTVNYDPVGSGGGRRVFLEGGVVFAGSDNVLDDAEIEESRQVCGPEGAIDLPIYVSPIAVAFNLPGIETVNISPENMARIFTGDLKRWNDPALVADNPGTSLPDLAVTPVHRSDDSGTTANFVDYLAAVAPDIWTWDVSGVWPTSGLDSAQGTSGVISAVQQTEGAITYADASRIGGLGTAAILVGGEWVSFSPEGAAAAVDASPSLEGRHEHDLAIAIDRATDAQGAYPLILVSYAVVCLNYQSQDDAVFVQEFIGFLTSREGQDVAAQIAGSAPISANLREKIGDSLAAITAG